MTIPSPEGIATVADVERWFAQLLDAGYNFHPDDSMVLTCDERVRLGYRAKCDDDPCPGHVEYVNGDTGEPSMSVEEGRRYDLAMDKAFEVTQAADVDIYAIGMDQIRARLA